MAKTLISLGANLGNPRQVMQLAGEMILNRFGASNVVFSRLYRTPAVGGPVGQDDFYNAVATIESNATAFEVWRNLNAIEQSLGRKRRHRWEARRIDLDVLLHNEERHWTPTLKVPHPRMIMRTFVLEPACEIAASWIEPVTGQSIESLSLSLRQLRGTEIGEAIAIHYLVLSESIERANRIAASLVEGSNRSAMSEPNTANRIFLEANDRVTVELNPFQRVTIQSLASLSRSATASQIDELRGLLDEQIAEFQTTNPLHLLIFAGASPDPSVIHWEDSCRNSFSRLVSGIISHNCFR